MKRFALTLVVCALGVCGSAQAKGQVHQTTPAGNSGVNQYLETVPTDHGSRPTNSFHAGGSGGGGGNASGGGGGGGGVGSGTGGGSGSGNGSGGSGGSAGASGSGSSVSLSTQRALDARGPQGRAAAALARNTAPAGARNHGGLGATERGQSSTGGSHGGASALGSLVSALTGSASNGGLGPLLPLILVVVLFGTAGMTLLRRHRRT